MGGAPDVGVGGVGLLDGRAVGQVAGEQPLAHLGAATQLGHETGVQPWLVDAQPRVRQQPVAVEPLDVVALVGGAVAPDVDLVLGHRAHQQGAGDGAAERGGVEVGEPRGADVEGAAGQRDQPLLDESRAAVDDPGDTGAVLLRPAGHAGQVGLVVLAEVGGVGAGNGTVLAHPGDGDRGVEPPGERDADLLALGQGFENLGHVRSLSVRCGLSGTAAAGSVRGGAGETVLRSGQPARAARRRPTSSPVRPSRATTRIVSSPAIVPMTSARLARSIALARNCAAPGGVRSTARLAEAL